MRRLLGLSPLQLLLVALDASLVALGLRIASSLRLLLPYGEEVTSDIVLLPWGVYLLAEISWISALADRPMPNPQ